ncbi:MAG TPA: DUF11 domain-containing protein [Thermoanaerobaculia bacterium]|nr:DUF11 domain-containing protein [Thermoanaerobaculia bacterium]
MIRRFPVLSASLLVCVLTPAVFAQSADLAVGLLGPPTIFANYDTATAIVAISIINFGPATVQDATIDFDPGLVINIPNFTCATATNHTRCTSSSFPPSEIRATGSMQVQQPANGTVVTISATVTSALTSDPNPANNTSSVSETVVWQSFVDAGFDLAKSMPPGLPFTTDVVLDVKGPSYATDVKITFSLPQHVFLRQASWDKVFTCLTPPIGSPGDVVCTAKKVGPDDPTTIEVSATVDPTTPVGTILSFVATPTCSDAAPPPHPLQTNITVIAPANLEWSIVSPAFVEPGDTFANNVTVTNSGPSAAVNTIVAFTTTSSSTPATIGTPSAPAGWTCFVGKDYVAGCSISSFPPGTATFSFPTSVMPDSSPGKLIETGGAFSLSNVNAIGAATATTWVSPEKLPYVTPFPDLSVALTANPATLSVGDTVTFTALVTNAGGVAAPNVTINAPLPPFLAFVSATGQCTGDSEIHCLLGTVAPGGWSTTTITARAVAPGTSSVTATAATDGLEPHAGNNSATAPITVSAPAVRRRAARH